MAIMDRIFSSRKDDLEIRSPYRSEEDDCLSCRLMGESFLVLELYGERVLWSGEVDSGLTTVNPDQTLSTEDYYCTIIHCNPASTGYIVRRPHCVSISESGCHSCSPCSLPCRTSSILSFSLVKPPDTQTPIR